MRNLPDLSGEVFSFLTVIRRNNDYTWEVVCRCGTHKKAATWELQQHRVKSCGSNECRKQAGSFHKLPDGVSARNKIIGRYKRLAEKRNLPFCLTIKQLDALFKGNCHYCGASPAQINTNDGGTYIFNGIDRKDPHNGYTKNNSVSCCKTCNWAKGLTPYSKFLDYLNQLVRFRVNKTK